MNRRAFLQQAVGSVAASTLGFRAVAAESDGSLAAEIGITTGTFSKHLASAPNDGKLALLDLPRLMRDELDIRVIDLMTATVPSLTPDYLDRLRAAADRAGCVLTNLKMNQSGLDIASPDEPARRAALDEYKRTMTAAARLAVRWVRPLPGRAKGVDFTRLASSYRELIEHGARLGITLLIENIGWIKDDAGAIPAIVKEVGAGLRAQPDTGNWTDAARYDGLVKAFPLAASCDFKALKLEPDGSHPAYDLKRCFQIGWDAGFRGPWCLEHSHEDFQTLLRELKLLRDHLRDWIGTGGRR